MLTDEDQDPTAPERSSGIPAGGEPRNDASPWILAEAIVNLGPGGKLEHPLETAAG
jgi:hypothetical protein